VGDGVDEFGSGQGPVTCSFEHVKEPLGYIKCWESIEWLSCSDFS
jgi:hypothetical protein